MSESLGPRQLAALAGVSTDTLRHYERIGVLPAPARTAAVYRRYGDASVARVQLIRRALIIGFSLKDLGRILKERDRGGAPCRKVRATVCDRLARIDQELAALTALKSDLTALLEDWDQKLAATPPRIQARLLDSMGCTKTPAGG